MKKSWRKNTAALLTCLFLVLSFTVEFGHTHDYSQTSLLIKKQCECEISSYETSSVENGYDVCFTCVFSQTHVVLIGDVLASQTFIASQTFYLTEEQTFPAFVGSLFNNRAPPQKIS